MSPGPGQATITDFSDSGSILSEAGGAGTEKRREENEIRADFIQKYRNRQPDLNFSHEMRAGHSHVTGKREIYKCANLGRFFLLCVPAVPECHLPSMQYVCARRIEGKEEKVGERDPSSPGDGRCAGATVTLREISGEGREGGGGPGIAGIRCLSQVLFSLRQIMEEGDTG